MKQQTYSLHILRHDPPSHACTIALSKLPSRSNASALMPLATFPSSKQLASSLSRLGVRAAVLEKMERSLDDDGLETLTNLLLSDEQVATLGFKLYRLKYEIPAHPGQSVEYMESSCIAKINKWIALADIALAQGPCKRTA